MTSRTGSQTMQEARLDRTLEYTLVRSWDELMPDSSSGLIQIEYHTGSDGSLDFLKIWASTIRGHWDLICEFWAKPLWSHATGLLFGPAFDSAEFAHTLERVIGRENAFVKLPDQHGLIQVFPPAQVEREQAERWMEVAFDHEGAIPTQQPVAA